MRLRYLIILIIILLALFTIRSIRNIKSFLSNFDYKFDIMNIDSDISRLLNFDSSSIVRMYYKIRIFNLSTFNLSVSNIRLKVYYAGALIAETDKNRPENNKSFWIKPTISEEVSSKTDVTSSLDLFVKRQTIDLINKYNSKQDFNVRYKISLNLFGYIPVFFSNDYEYKH